MYSSCKCKIIEKYLIALNAKDVKSLKSSDIKKAVKDKCDYCNKTALHLYANFSNININEELLFYFIDLGADLNKKDLMGDTPLDLLLYNISNYNIVKKIVDNYFNKIDPSIFAFTILNILNETEESKYIELYKILLKKNNFYNNPGKELESKMIEIVRKSVQDGEDRFTEELLKINVRNYESLIKVAFVTAFEMGNIELIEKLWKRYKKTIKTNKDDTDGLIHLACKINSYFLVDFIIKNFSLKMDFFVSDEDKNNSDEDNKLQYPPLSWAVLSSDKNIFLAILKESEKQNINKMNLLINNNKNIQYDPVAIAINNEKYQEARILLEYGYFTNQYVFKELFIEGSDDLKTIEFLSDFNIENMMNN